MAETNESIALDNIAEEILALRQTLVRGMLTKREQIAAMAMQGLLAGYAADLTGNLEREPCCLTLDRVSQDAVEYADALIAKLSQTGKEKAS